MKIYFTSQLYQIDKHINYFKAITNSIPKLGHELIVDIYDYSAEFVLTQTVQEQQAYYKCWYGYLKDMDICIAEISFPSTVNVGFEVASILNAGKPVIALYRKNMDPRFISPEFSQKMIKCEYDLDNVESVLEWAIEEAQGMLNRRFTMFINSEIENYLSKVSQGGVSRSEFIRKLIEREMKSGLEPD